MRLDKYDLTKSKILEGEIAEFDAVKVPKKERDPMYLAAPVEMIIKDVFADLRETLEENDMLTEKNSELSIRKSERDLEQLELAYKNDTLAKENRQLKIELYEAKLNSDAPTKKALFSLLMTVIEMYELENLFDLREHLVEYGKNIHVRTMNEILTYNMELVKLTFDAVHQEKQRCDELKQAPEYDGEWFRYWKLAQKMVKLVCFISDQKQPSTDRLIAVERLTELLKVCAKDDALTELTKGYRDTMPDTRVNVGYEQVAVSEFLTQMVKHYSKPYPTVAADELLDLSIVEVIDERSESVQDKSLCDLDVLPEPSVPNFESLDELVSEPVDDERSPSEAFNDSFNFVVDELRRKGLDKKLPGLRLPKSNIQPEDSVPELEMHPEEPSLDGILIEELLSHVELDAESLPDSDIQSEEEPEEEPEEERLLDDLILYLDWPLNAYSPQEIKRIQKMHGLSQKEFAKQLGVSRDAVRAWGNGSYNPSDKHMAGIYAFVECKACELDNTLYILPKHIKLIRDSCQLSLAAFSRKLGVSTYVISRWEAGASTPSKEMAEQINMIRLGLDETE